MLEIKGKVNTAIAYANVIEVLKPVYNFKASKSELYWMKNKKADSDTREVN